MSYVRRSFNRILEPLSSRLSSRVTSVRWVTGSDKKVRPDEPSEDIFAAAQLLEERRSNSQIIRCVKALPKLKTLIYLLKGNYIPSKNRLISSGELDESGTSSILLRGDNLRRSYTQPCVSSVDDSIRATVQFSIIEYLLYEGGSVNLKVTRNGDCSSRIEVKWEAENINISDFKPLSGSIIFESGQTEAMLSYPSTENVLWSIETMMEIALEVDKENEAGVALGDPSRCRVVFLNDDKFPRDSLKLESWGDILFGYFQHMLSALKKEVPIAILWKCVPGLSLVLYELNTYQIINNISSEEGSSRSIFVQAIIFVAIFLMASYADMSFLKLKIRGKSRWLMALDSSAYT